MAERRPPLIERTTSRGMVNLKFPGLEASFPATNRSVMVILVAAIIAIIIIVPVCFYEIFNARPEALEGVGNILGRKPAKVPMQTSDGIEMIEVCPPCPRCPTCEEMGCGGEVTKGAPAMMPPL